MKFILSLVLAAVVLPVMSVGASTPAADHHVVVISLDGFPADQFWDINVSIPILRKLAAEGAVAKRLNVTNPSTTWSNHATLITGVSPNHHSIIYNGLLVRKPGTVPFYNPKLLTAQDVHAPTILDVIHAAGLRTASIDWPDTKGSPSIDDNMPDSPDGFEVMTGQLRDELIASGVFKDKAGHHFYTSTAPARDNIWLEAACQVIRARQPNLLLLHLLNTDGAHHKYGAGTYGSQSAMALADQYVGQVLRTLTEAGIREQTTVFVVSDHGFYQPKQAVYPNVILRQAGWLKAVNDRSVHEARGYVLTSGGTASVYLTAPADREAAKALFQGKPGIASVLLPAEFTALGWPSPDKDPLAPDLVLVPADGFVILQQVMGDDTTAVLPRDGGGYHGYLASLSQMDGIFVASGRDIKPGAQLDHVANRDLAPTVAHLLGTEMAGTEGRVLTEFLRTP